MADEEDEDESLKSTDSSIDRKAETDDDGEDSAEDFDDFEAGAEDEDFGDFGEGFEQSSVNEEEQEGIEPSTPPIQPLAHSTSPFVSNLNEFLQINACARVGLFIEA